MNTMMVRGGMVALLIASLAGCGHVETRKTLVEQKAEAAELTQRAVSEAREGAVETREEMWFGAGELALETGGKSGVLNEQMSLARGVPVTIDFVAQQISRNFGLRVSVLQDATLSAMRVQPDPVNAVRGLTAAEGTFYLNFEGTVRGLLDVVAARTGNSWREEPDGSVTIFHHETRTFVLAVFPGSTTLTTSISSVQKSGAGGGGGGGDSGSSESEAGQETEVSLETSSLDEAIGQVKSMLGPDCTMAASPSSGTVTATCTPSVLDQVEAFLSNVNDRKTKNLVYTVRIYDVELNKSDTYGLNWDVVWESLNGRWGGGFTTLSGVNTDNQFELALIDPDHNYSGSSIVADALSEQGDVTVLTNTTTVGMNGEVTPIQVARRTSYKARVATTITPNVGTTTEITPGVATTGTTLRLWPMVLSGDSLMLQVEADLTSLRELRRVGGVNDFIEVPEIDSRKILQRVRMRSGQTLVISGFEQDRNRANDRGIGSPSFWGLGGSIDSATGRTVVVVMITVRVAS
jgi:type IVB pilus formation R64 PilN family outer membrane protein